MSFNNPLRQEIQQGEALSSTKMDEGGRFSSASVVQ